MTIGSSTLDIPVPETEAEIAAFRNNLNVGGLFVPLSRPVTLRTRMRIRLIGRGEPVELLAEVVHVGSGFVGFQLINFTPSDRFATESLLQGTAAPARPGEEKTGAGAIDDDIIDDDIIDDEIIEEQTAPPPTPAAPVIDDEVVDDEIIDDEIIDDEVIGEAAPPLPSAGAGPTAQAESGGEAAQAEAAPGLFDDAFGGEGGLFADAFAALTPEAPPPPAAQPPVAPPPQAAPPPIQRPAAPPPPPAPPVARPPAGPAQSIESDLPTLLDRWAREQGDKPPPKGLPPNTVAAVLLAQIDHPQGVEVSFTDARGVSTRIVAAKGRLMSVSRQPRPAGEANIAEILRKDGQLENQHYTKAIEEHRATGRPLELLLRDNVEPRALGMALRALMKKDLALCFSTPRLEARVGPANLRDILPMPIEARRTVFNGLRDAAAVYPTEQLIKGMRGFGRYFVARADPLPMPVTELDLRDADLRFWETTLARPVAMRQIFAVSALSQTASLRMLYALRIFGMIQFITDWVPDADEVLKPYREMVENLERDDPYDVLELHWTALRDDVERAHKRLTDRWMAFRVHEAAKAEMDRLRERALARLGTAYRFLSDENRRRAHRDKKVDEGQRMGSAQLSYEQARMALFSKDYREARRLASVAVDLNPSEAEYRQFLAKIPPV